jgi:hypothetical protein
MNTPQTPHPSHIDIDTLADLQEGLLEAEQASTVAEHLDGCAACRARSEALDDVRAALREGAVDADVAAPEDVVRRLDDALAAAAAPLVAAPLATASATVTPLTALTRRARQPWKTRVLQAAAIFVLVAGLGAVGYGGIHALGGGGGSTGTDSAAGGSGTLREKSSAHGKYIITRSGRDYTTTSLRSAVPGLLSHAVSDSVATGPDGPSPTSSSTRKADTPAAASADPGRLLNGTALAECVANLAGGPVTPLAVDIGRFEGKPATIIVLPDPDDASFVNAYAVAPGCPTGTFLAWVHVALP